MSHSERAYQVGMKLDFQGILLLMWGATVPLIYYGLAPCPSSLSSSSPSQQLSLTQTAYLCATTALALACSAVSVGVRRFSGPHLGAWRAALFGAFGVGSFAAPIAHGALLLLHRGGGGGWALQSRRLGGLAWILATLLCNALGAAAYMLKVCLLSSVFCLLYVKKKERTR